MVFHTSSANYDPLVSITDPALTEQFGDTALLGNWFTFLTQEWFQRFSAESAHSDSHILFRGHDITLPGVKLTARTLPEVKLLSLTSDKSLYRLNRDTVHVLVAAPQQAKEQVTLALALADNPYAEYTLTLDSYGLCLWPLRDLPEGEYVATIQGYEQQTCRFEVAEYRLAPLNAELIEQQLTGNMLRYVLGITAFGQPYTGSVEIELHVQGQRVGERTTLRCNREGQCRGAVKLVGDGLHVLHVIAGERTAMVVLKGSEQQRREFVTISELGELRLLSLLPSPQSNACRGMYISRGGANTAPFLVRRVIGNEVEITARVAVDYVRIVVIDAVHGTSKEISFEQVKAEQLLRLAIPQPYGVVLIGALIDGKAWEGWCAVVRPSDLHLQCEAPREAKPGSTITITLKTGSSSREVPVQLIVKDQRLTAASDPQVEFAACIKQNLNEWQQQTVTGNVERQLAQMSPYRHGVMRHGMLMRTMNVSAMAVPPQAAMPIPTAMPMPMPMPMMAAPTGVPVMAPGQLAHAPVAAAGRQEVSTLTTIRMQFPEVVHNSLLHVRGEAQVQVKLGDSLTRYSIEAFALSTETMDWQRVETAVDAVQSVYGELTVSPFVFSGDKVLGRLDVGAASGGAIVEVRHDGELLPLFSEDGSAVTQGIPMPSGSVVRFLVKPGTITALVRDARKGGVDVSERYVTEPGVLRHIVRRMHLLNAGDEVTLDALHALELRPMPGLERPFHVFVESATLYPFGCVEQTSTKLFAMVTGYITNAEQRERAREYESAIGVWYKRLKSMYLPGSGFCLYPPDEGGTKNPDTHYAPLAVKNLLQLPTAERANVQAAHLREALDDIRAMAQDAANYYTIALPPRKVENCHDAYLVLSSDTASEEAKANAAAFVRSRLREQHRQTYVDVAESPYLGFAVARRAETAYAAAALLATKEPADLAKAIAATNYVTSQINEEGRFYSTVDTAACLALLLGLREAGLVSPVERGRVAINGQALSLQEALSYQDKVESVRCLEGLIAVQVTSEVIEHWGAFQGKLAVAVRLEKKGQAQEQFTVGDEVDLVIEVARYEPGLLAHVCLPDALVRLVGGGQVKRFSLDFCGKNVLRVPLVAVSPTNIQEYGSAVVSEAVQHWAVLVRNMFQEEMIGNPGLQEVIVGRPHVGVH